MNIYLLDKIQPTTKTQWRVKVDFGFFDFYLQKMMQKNISITINSPTNLSSFDDIIPMHKTSLMTKNSNISIFRH